MNLHAYFFGDLNKSLVHMDDWVVKYGLHTDGYCRICHEPMFIKGQKSQKQTHFCHYPNSTCPSVVKNHKPYNALLSLPRDPALAISAKQWLKTHAVAVYEKLRTEFTDLALQWKEFHQLIDTANRLDVWSLKGMPHEYIPYVLLMCRDIFEITKFRKRECYFVLEPSPSGISYWNESEHYKKFIWRVYPSQKEVVHYHINTSIKTPWYINKINQLLE